MNKQHPTQKGNMMKELNIYGHKYSAIETSKNTFRVHEDGIPTKWQIQKRRSTRRMMWFIDDTETGHTYSRMFNSFDYAFVTVTHIC